MSVNFSGKWKVQSMDGNGDELMTKVGYNAQMIDYMKTKLSFEVKHTGNDYETSYTKPDGTVKTVKGTVGVKFEDKDLMGRQYSSMSKMDGDKMVTDVTYADASMPKTNMVREIKGNAMVVTSTLVDSGLKAVTTFEKC